MPAILPRQGSSTIWPLVRGASRSRWASAAAARGYRWRISGLRIPSRRIEPMIILKDSCRATDRETEAVVRWMMDVLVDAALREAR